MYTTIDAAPTSAHLSRHERERLARARAFSRRTPASPPEFPVVALQRSELEPDRAARARRPHCGVERSADRHRGLTRAAARRGSASVTADDPIVEEVLRFEDLPPGSMASRRAVVRWSDGSESEAIRYYADELLSPVDHVGWQ
jgi:hypothetical protein